MLQRSSAATRQRGLAAPRAERPTFDELYAAHVDSLWANARRLGVANDAVDDVLQQVFIVVHRRLATVTMTGSWKAWLFGVLIHVVRDHKRLLRRKSPHLREPTDPATLVDGRRRPDESLVLAEATAIMQRWLAALDDEKREVFILAELEQLSAIEIAAATGTNQYTVSSRLRAARRAIEVTAARYRDAEARRS